jgi:serine phosphatase RsbU (regulator of sigma subunit)/anti-sigma regulatory factor (Ser/Thr protein kinase)/PAS domain-containing protein
MISRNRQPAPKGSWRWAVRVAEVTAWGTAGLVSVLLLVAELDQSTFRAGLGVVLSLGLWLSLLFRVLIPRLGARRWMLPLSVLINLAFAGAVYALMRGEVAGVQLVFVPVIVATGLLGKLPEALLAPTAAIAIYAFVAEITGEPPAPGAIVITAGVFMLSGGVAGLLARELRHHYRGEREEHRLATAVRHRLMAVVDAIDQAIIFSDRNGIVRVVNRRAAELFDIDSDEYLGLLVVQLNRTLARQMEDPEGFMETFQTMRDDPDLEFRSEVEQILPNRRQLRLFSSPALDDYGVLVGRIDVYTDVTEAVRRAAEVERLYEEARRTAESYQRSLLPESAPSLPRVSFVAHYVPAAGERAVCGDFYDFVTLPDGKLGVALGDVCGVGPMAVSDCALTRYTLQSFAEQDADPGKLLARMNGHIGAHLSSERFVRLMFGVLDPERAVFEYANAGHVPPVVYKFRTGEVEWLGEGGIALAVEEDSDYKVGRVELEPGDMLVLYTDGVTEAPRHGRPYGQGRFLDLVTEYGVGTPGEMSQAIRRSVDSWVEGGQLRDDLAILVCQVIPDSAIDEPTRELVLPNERSRLREIRGFVGQFLADVRAPVDISSEILLAVGEAAGNATKYGRRGEGRSEIRVRCAVEGAVVSVTVVDDGPGFEPVVSDQLPDRFASGGRGLFLMREFMDSVDISSSSDGTTVLLAREVFADRVLNPAS